MKKYFSATKVIKKWVKPYKRKRKKVNGYYRIIKIKTKVGFDIKKQKLGELAK